MPNPKPTQTPQFRSHCYQKVDGYEPLHPSPISVKVLPKIRAAIAAMPTLERGAWLRRVITEAAEKELINPSTPGAIAEQKVELLISHPALGGGHFHVEGRRIPWKEGEPLQLPTALVHPLEAEIKRLNGLSQWGDYTIERI
ncbi:hypothetical protein L3556_06070 [Candidatus Synechococcus calcipolaris G9]|uniref:Uncharacterized protein n=1 Tax=Candidatus Synechococcus calcipolaris G9 TaxID=1497997 RepID=A0ABT6EYT2_9SYNE|nr:hypothetical protein [Candidatus Synechococcus calcipolaris]MDG2990501.1 hypothetical protein [Candidatus Synechococcus calcipolaris G9]